MKSEHKSRTELKIEDSSSKMRNPPPWWWYGTTGTKKGYHTTKIPPTKRIYSTYDGR